MTSEILVRGQLDEYEKTEFKSLRKSLLSYAEKHGRKLADYDEGVSIKTDEEFEMALSYLHSALETLGLFESYKQFYCELAANSSEGSEFLAGQPKEFFGRTGDFNNHCQAIIRALNAARNKNRFA